jgi:Flp pilus assembly pilin Flp
MKIGLFITLLLCSNIVFSQVQIGNDIDGAAAGDYSGEGVSLSSDGNIVAIGSPRNDDNGSGAGHVRIFQNISGTWIQIGAPITGDADFDYFGRSVSLSADGNVVAIGAHSNNASGNKRGYVRIFKNIAGVWTQVGSDIDGVADEDNSGRKVSLSANGNVLAISAPLNDTNGINSGHVRIFENVSGVWTQIGTAINGEASNDQSGWSISLSGDGAIIAIGAPFSNDNGSLSGHVRVYQNIANVWTQIGNDIVGESAGDYSSRVSLSSDGTTLAIGAIYNQGVNGIDSGHVRVFKNISGVWTQIGSDIDGEAPIDEFGHSVSLSSNGNVLAVGSRRNDGNGPQSGHARVYQYVSGDWTQVGIDIDGEAEYDNFGYDVSLSADGSILAVGSRANDGNGIESGHVRVFDVSALLSIEDEELTPIITLLQNPVDNHLKIQIPVTSDFTRAIIYNTNGQFVLRSTSPDINVSRLAKGVYLLEVETTTGKAIKKFIKQ